MPTGHYVHAKKLYPPAMVARVMRLYATGQTQTEIAAQLGTTQKVIWRLMRRHGVATRPAAKRDQRGERNDSWRGDAATYGAFHARVATWRGKPSQCEDCGRTGSGHYDWANITGNFADPSDYRRLCRSCHWKLDRKIENIWKGRKEACL